MIKLIINIVELVIIAKVVYKTIRFFLPGNKKQRGKTIFGKITKLTSNKIHHVLDDLIKAQKEKRLALGQVPDNVVSLADRKKA